MLKDKCVDIMRKFHYLFIFILLLTSCIGYKHDPMQIYLSQSNCNQQNAYTYVAEELPQPFHQNELDPILRENFSLDALHIANSINLLAHISDYMYKKQDFQESPSLEKKLALLDLYQTINQRINIASLEISATASEMDCEEERAEQIANYLKSKESDTETLLTVSAITVGATGAIISGMLLINGDTGNTPDYIGLGAGITEAFLGLGILLNKRKVNFYHHRNALRDLWEGHEVSKVFPTSVWYYLNYYDTNEPSKPSLRYQILDKWMSFEQLADASSNKKENLLKLFFGDGGKYTAEQLKNRADMYDQLEAYISLMKQELKTLAIEFENVKQSLQ